MSFTRLMSLAAAGLALSACEPAATTAPATTASAATTTTTTTTTARTTTTAAATTTAAPTGGFVAVMSPNVPIEPIRDCAAAVQAQTSKIISVVGSQPVTGGALIYVEAGGNNPERWICRNMGGQITITAV